MNNKSENLNKKNTHTHINHQKKTFLITGFKIITQLQGNILTNISYKLIL